jgi:hypothetical protein
MPRLILAAALLVPLGCSRQSAPTPDVSAAVAAEPSSPTASPKPDPPAAPPKPTDTPTAFAYPPDLAGQTLPRVVAPAAPALPPTERLGQAPLGRTPPTKLLHPEPEVKVVYVPTPVALPRPGGLRPVAPPERVPLDLGAGVGAVPARPILPEGPGITQRAADVNLPPALPPLGRPVPDRAPLDDPTADQGNAAIVGRSVTPALGPSAFQKLGLPDPFEFAAQVKPRVPPAAEPGVVPVPVNPERMK